MSITPLPNSKAAWMALYAADAETLFNAVKNSNNPTAEPTLPTTPYPDVSGFAVIDAKDWEIAGQIRCDDDLRVLQNLRRIFGLGEDNYYFGFLLRCRTADVGTKGGFQVGDYLAMVRGTMEPKEWLLDAMALPDLFEGMDHQDMGVVPAGFYSIYDSMTLLDANGRDLGHAATAIGDIVNRENNRLTVVGHSLGAALATYLTFDLAAEVHEPAKNLDAYIIACPNPGDTAFVKKFRTGVPAYNVVNWERDFVPKVPPQPYGPLLNGSPTQNVLLLTAGMAGIGKEPQDTPGCNHHAVCYARMLDSGNTVANTLSMAAKC